MPRVYSSKHPDGVIEDWSDMTTIPHREVKVSKVEPMVSDETKVCVVCKKEKNVKHFAPSGRKSRICYECRKGKDNYERYWWEM